MLGSNEFHLICLPIEQGSAVVMKLNLSGSARKSPIYDIWFCGGRIGDPLKGRSTEAEMWNVRYIISGYHTPTPIEEVFVIALTHQQRYFFNPIRILEIWEIRAFDGLVEFTYEWCQ